MGNSETIGPNTPSEIVRRLYDYQRFSALFDWLSDGAQILYRPALREFSIPHEDGASAYVLSFCPISGQRLPPSLRDEWFDSLEAAGLLPLDALMPSDFVAPETLRSDAWWRDTDLAVFD
jgi:hypothetical protein